MKKSKTETVAYKSKKLAIENDGNGDDIMRKIPLRYVKKGDAFKLKPTDTATIYIKDDYDRSLKKYSCYNYNDIGKYRMVSPSTIVYIDFYF